jgi:hypothetical protein
MRNIARQAFFAGSPATAWAMAEYLSVQMLPRRVRTRRASSRACMRYPSSLISCSQSEPSGASLTRAASCGFAQVGKVARSASCRPEIITGCQIDRKNAKRVHVTPAARLRVPTERVF